MTNFLFYFMDTKVARVFKKRAVIGVHPHVATPNVHLLYDIFYSLYWGRFCPTTKNEGQFSNMHRQVISLFFSLASVSHTSPPATGHRRPTTTPAHFR